jgi:hypothetical protein
MTGARRAQLERLLTVYGQRDPVAVQYLCDFALESAVVELRMTVIVCDSQEYGVCTACAHRQAG